MHIDSSRFPLVWMSSCGPSNWEPELNAFLSRDEPFLLLTRDRPDREHDANGGDRKRFALWFKSNRELFKRVCAGSIVIVSSEVIALPLRALVAPLARAFGYPVRVTTEDRLGAEIAALLKQL